MNRRLPAPLMVRQRPCHALLGSFRDAGGCTEDYAQLWGKGFTDLETFEYEWLQLADILVIRFDPHPVLADHEIPCVSEYNSHPVQIEGKGTFIDR